MFTDTIDPTRRIVTPAERIRALITRVAAEHGVSYADVMGRRRLHAVARHAVWYALWKDEGWAYHRIARWFGRDHTTIAYGLGCHILANGLPGNWMSERVLRKQARMAERNAAANRKGVAA